MKTRIVTDSGGGLDQDTAKSLGIDLLPLQVGLEDKQYLDGATLDTATLYDALANGVMPQTSMPPLGLVEDLFENYADDGVTDIILINLSNGLSGTNGTLQARAKEHGLNIHTLDLYTTLAIQKYLAKAAKQLLDQGLEPDEIIKRLEAAVDKSKGYLIPENLDHLAKGGRLTPVAAALGGLLKIKPVLEVSKATEGKVDAKEKIRTMNRAIRKAATLVKEDVEPGLEYRYFIVDSRNPEAAGLMADALKDYLGETINIETDDIAAVIAAHTGLGAVGVQYIPVVEGTTL